MTRLILCTGLVLLAVSFIMGGCSSKDEEDGVSVPEPERISVEELKNLLDSNADVVVVDVRSKESYDELHIPGAIFIPVGDIEKRHEELPRDKTIILY